MSFLIYQIIIFQGVAEMVFDRLPKSSREMTLLQIYLKKTQLSSLSASNVKHQNTFDPRPEDLSTKGLERFHGKLYKEKGAFKISVKPLAEILMYANIG